MIHSFTFKNFYSFADKATISFEDIRKGVETKSNMFSDTLSGSRLSKVMILVGPNASGKTNALKVLSFLSWFLSFVFISPKGEKEKIPFDTFAFSEHKDDIAELEVVFECNAKTYKYILHLCQTHIIKEELYRKEKTQHFNYLFKRSWDPYSQGTSITAKCIDNSKIKLLEDILRRNISLVSAGVAIKNDLLTEIAEYWQSITSNLYQKGKAWNASSLGAQGLLKATKAYHENKKLFDKAKQFLKDIDLGLDTVSINEGELRDDETGKTKKIYIPRGVHKVNGKNYPLPFAYESSGTKNMFVLLHFLLPTIERGGIAVIDELEMDLHPHTLPKIIELFVDPETNPKNSQLLFTSHSLDILNHLEKEQVVLVEKKQNGKSELYRLDELKGIRRDDNIYAKYMAGAYGAVPNI